MSCSTRAPPHDLYVMTLVMTIVIISDCHHFEAWIHRLQWVGHIQKLNQSENQTRKSLIHIKKCHFINFFIPIVMFYDFWTNPSTKKELVSLTDMSVVGETCHWDLVKKLFISCPLISEKFRSDKKVELKGQIVSKGFFWVSSISSKKRTKTSQPEVLEKY